MVLHRPIEITELIGSYTAVVIFPGGLRAPVTVVSAESTSMCIRSLEAGEDNERLGVHPDD